MNSSPIKRSRGAADGSGTQHRRFTSMVAALALILGGAVAVAPLAQAGTTPPFTIGPNGSAIVPGADATGPNASNPQDIFGSLKELGPLNQNTTKIGVIHNDPVPTLGLTNPNAQVDLRQAWINSAQDSDGDDWVYFAWERDNNSGSGFIAFEFMKNKAPTVCDDYDPNSATVLASCNPWANRQGDPNPAPPQEGDFMILWDQQGGSRDLFYREWHGTAPNLTLTPSVQLSSSVAVAAYSADGFRGEAAINITDVVFGGTPSCLAFANIIPSTVTGNSDTADYKDTILQPGVDLSDCTTTTTTTPQDDAGNPIPQAGIDLGTDGVVQVKDSALIDIQGGAANPAGTIDFTLCEANNAANADCDTGGKSVLVGDDVAVSDPDGAFPVTVTSPSAWITAAGRYCWKAVYSGIPAQNITGSSDVSIGECFVVNPVTPTLSTAAGDDVTLGSPVTDVATLSGTAPKPTANVIETSAPNAASRTKAGGTITFTLFGPSSSGCGSQIAAATQQVTVNGDSSATQVYSATFTPTQAGDYHWKASYSGDTPNTKDQSHNATCSETNEDVTVGPASTTTLTTPRVGSTPITAPVAVNTVVNDHALVTGTSAGGSPTGTVDFFICNPSQVTGAAGAEVCASPNGSAVTGNPKALTVGANNTSSAVSGNVTANVVGVWCFRAVYTSDTANYTGSSDATHGECFTVNDATSATSAQTWLPNDAATITATGGTALNGTVSFTLYDSANCTGTVLRDAETFTLTNAVSLADRTKSTTNGVNVPAGDNIQVTTDKTVSWKVVFTSTDPLVGSSNHCESTVLDITN
jgi:hypothetical protein